ncbi:MAG: ExbD/TolR family protein [Planctomycetota bacterium]
MPHDPASQPNEPFERLSIRLPGDGTVHVDDRLVTLNELGRAIVEHRYRHDPRNGRKHGFVRLRAHRAVPWRHVRWVLGVAAESGLHFVFVDVRTPKRPTRTEPPWAAQRFTLGFFEPSAPPGGDLVWLTVSFEPEGGYGFEGRATADLAVLTGWIGQSLQRMRRGGLTDDRLVFRVDGIATKPLDAVVRVLEAFDRNRVERFCLGAVEPAPAPVRELRKLPGPARAG